MSNVKKILIVEDELIVATVLKLQLVDEGFDVINVTTSEAALVKVKEFEPDYIIMDVFLKNKGNGIETAKIIRQQGINTPIVFTTGNSYDSTVQQLEGVKDYKVLIKPVEFLHLLELFKKKK